MIKRALISVFDKSGIVEFASVLDKLDIEILSTGGTAKKLKEEKIRVTDVSDYTGFPEMMGGRVKTLHPKIHGGLLAVRNNIAHMIEAKENKIGMIDMVVVNLYPFEESVKKNLVFDDTIEMIDIGGPAMIRSAAKNFRDVLVVIDPCDYGWIIELLKEGKEIAFQKRKELAKKVFEKTSAYDAAISQYLAGGNCSDSMWPDNIFLSYKKKQEMRYGENPYQVAAFYTDSQQQEIGIGNAQQLCGKELSYNNIMDADASLDLIKEFSDPCAVIIKHANPCGVASCEKIEDALIKAYNADSLSAFGGIIALNRICNIGCANFLNEKFIEVIIAPDYDRDALELLMKSKNRRILKLPILTDFYHQSQREKLTNKKVKGGLLVQTTTFPDLDIDKIKIVQNENPTKEDIGVLIENAKKNTVREFLCVTKKKPSKEQLIDMIFAIKVSRYTKSNTIIYVKDKVTIGIGAGQMSRVDAARIATQKAGEKAIGSVMVSDAFFPFRDTVDEAAKAGIAAIVQPGGSIRDKESIDAANEHNMTMIFTGIRLFKH
ncbi:MAG: bifunctional phosphoribosylaminoimidazolecarboxamide formyltransferase/IMP cyclohydrolase [archaeon]